jgi:hypothetical protein
MATLEPFYGNRLSEMVRRQLVLKGQACLDDLIADAAGDDRIIVPRCASTRRNDRSLAPGYSTGASLSLE